MRIDGTGRIIPGTSRTAGAASSSGAVFKPETQASPSRPTQTSSIAASAGIDALLAIQAADDATTGRRRAIRRANSLLDALEDIRGDLLAGVVSEGRLNRAMALLSQAKATTEPGLDALVADIELRVRVELAKLGKYPPL